MKLHKKVSLRESLLRVVKNPQTWGNGIIIGCLYAPTAAFSELWGASYLHTVYGFSPDVAASGDALIFIGWAILSPLVGWLSDFIGKRKPVVIGSLVLSAIFMSLVLYLPHLSTAALFILLFCYGLSNVGVATGYAIAGEQVNSKIAATSMSFANMASVIIGALFQSLIGWLLMHNTKPELTSTHSHTLIATPHDYRMAMILLPICFIIGLLACL